MFAVTNLDEVKKIEKGLNEKHIVVLLFVKISDENADKYIKQFNYIHLDANKYCSIYAVGYTPQEISDEYTDKKMVQVVNNEKWYYSDKCFIDFKNTLQSRIKWLYSGEPEIIILQTNPDSDSDTSDYLNFRNYVTIEIDYGIRKGYIDSFPRFMTGLINASKKEIDSVSAIKELNRKKYFKVRNIVEIAIDSCKGIPGPIKKLLNDRLFFKSCNIREK